MDYDLPGNKLSIQAVIERGKQLQKEKPCNLNNKPSLHVLNDEVPCVKKLKHYGSRPRHRNPMSWTAPARSSFTARSSPSRCCKSRSTSPGFIVNPGSPRDSMITKRRLKCPLRIAELAVPSKRHCIQTWRERSDILPDFMLDRLKQLVLNQKVVATVPDAVQCFKYHQKRDSSSSSPIRSDTPSRNRKKSRGQAQSIDDIKIMSAVFAQRIAGRLIKNKNKFEQCLSDDLEKLSNVVAFEIKKLIQNRRVCADYVYNIEILKEMSAKITTWIIDILKEAQFNMLEDELKVQRERENKMGKDGNLETLIDQFVDFQMGERRSSQSLDLEEEEGPALDAIDTLVENVLDICGIKNDTDSSEYLGPREEDSTDELTQDELQTDEANAEEVNYENDQEQISTILSVNKDEVLDGDGNLAPEITNTDAIITIPDEGGVHNLTEMLEQQNEESYDQYDSTGEVDSTDSKKIVVETTDGDNNTNVSDVSVTLEDSLDDRKKVKFSQVNDDGAGEFGGIETDNKFEPELVEAEQILKSNKSLLDWPNYSQSATIIRSDIVFHPPNPSILSVADESWPDDFMIPVLKPSASVSKSITSLGEIKEIDEPVHHDQTVLKESANSISSYNGSTTSLSLNNEEPEEEETKTIEQEQLLSPAQDFKVTPSKLLSDLRSLVEADETVHLHKPEIKENNYGVNDIKSIHNASAGKGDHIQEQNSNQDDTDVDQSPIVQAIKEKLRQETQAKFDYRVHLQSAPSWAITSASDSEPHKDKPFEPNELRKWCKDMEHTLINLDQWNKWIHFTCKQVLYMKRQSVASTKLAPHDRTCVLAGWTKLKKCIDKDAILWRKLNDRTYQVLKMYSRKPKSRKSSPLRMQNKKRIKKEESMSEAMLTIDGMSMWLHRSIVSTEHIVKCNCRNPLSRPQTSPVTKKQRKKL